jgi:2'-phosphotransferase
MRGIDIETVLKLVEENAKKRFEVIWGYDPSPPLPSKKKGQQNKKKKSVPAPAAVEAGDAAEVDDLRKEMEQAMLGDKEEVSEWKELPLVVVDKEAGDENETEATWFIRASQGHSIKLEGTAHLTPVEDDEEGRARVGMMVHGTRDDLWDTIRKYYSIAQESS